MFFSLVFHPLLFTAEEPDAQSRLGDFLPPGIVSDSWFRGKMSNLWVLDFWKFSLHIQLVAKPYGSTSLPRLVSVFSISAVNVLVLAVLSSAGLILLHPDLLPSSSFSNLNTNILLCLKPVDVSLLPTTYSTNPLAWCTKPCRIGSHFPTHRPLPHAPHICSMTSLFSVMHFAVLHLRLLMTFYKIGQIPDECRVLQGYKNYPRPFCISFIQ